MTVTDPITDQQLECRLELDAEDARVRLQQYWAMRQPLLGDEVFVPDVLSLDQKLEDDFDEIHAELDRVKRRLDRSYTPSGVMSPA